MPAYRLLSVHEAGFARRIDAPMVGPSDELRRLRDAYDQAVRDRSCQLFTILGAAGVGKSRLAAEFLGCLGTTQPSSQGRCLPYGEGITYWPVVEVVKQLPAVGRIRSRRCTIAALLGDEQVVASSEEIAWAFRKLLEAARPSSRSSCVFDDLQWGEQTFLDLVEHVADLSGTRRSSFCAWPGRSCWIATGLGRRQAQRHEPCCSSRSRGGDDAADRRRWRGLKSTTLGERIVQSAEGNPLFVEQMVALVRSRPERRSRPADDPGAAGRAARPARAASATSWSAARSRAGSSTAGAVQALAPTEHEVAHASSASSCARSSSGPTTRELPGEDAFRFRHLLIRDAAYDAFAKSIRADLHERFAGWLEEAGADVASSRRCWATTSSRPAAIEPSSVSRSAIFRLAPQSG